MDRVAGVVDVDGVAAGTGAGLQLGAAAGNGGAGGRVVASPLSVCVAVPPGGGLAGPGEGWQRIRPLAYVAPYQVKEFALL